MGSQFFHSDSPSGFQYEKKLNYMRDNVNSKELNSKHQERDDDLIIEENTVYEIDRECYEKLKKQRKRK